jgi:hypothetical protein
MAKASQTMAKWPKRRPIWSLCQRYKSEVSTGPRRPLHFHDVCREILFCVGPGVRSSGGFGDTRPESRRDQTVRPAVPAAAEEPLANLLPRVLRQVATSGPRASASSGSSAPATSGRQTHGPLLVGNLRPALQRR